jgi:hypothetical protein
MASWLSASFLNLDNRSQIDDLRQHWDLLRSSGILPTLQTLAKLPPRNDGALGPYSREELKAAAFKRWYELDPAGARSEILAQIGSATPSLRPRRSLSCRRSLFLSSNLSRQRHSCRLADQQQENVLGSLLVYFGTGAATPQMIVKLNSRRVPSNSAPMTPARDGDKRDQMQ